VKYQICILRFTAVYLFLFDLTPCLPEVRSVSRRLPGCLPALRSVEPPAAGCLFHVSEQAVELT